MSERFYVEEDGPDGASFGIAAEGQEGFLALLADQSLARRIAAALNAVAAVPTDVLESRVVEAALGALYERGQEGTFPEVETWQRWADTWEEVREALVADELSVPPVAKA